MTKNRLPQSPEFAVKRAIELMPLPALAKAMQADPKLVYKYSDDTAHESKKHIHVWRALLADQIVYASTGQAPFRDLFDSNIDDATRKPVSIKETVLNAQSALGGVSLAVVTALSHQSDGGKVMTLNEAQHILISLNVLKGVIEDIERNVIAATKAKGGAV